MELSFGTFNLGPLFLLQKLTLIKLAHAVVDLYGVSRRMVRVCRLKEMMILKLCKWSSRL